MHKQGNMKLLPTMPELWCSTAQCLVSETHVYIHFILRYITRLSTHTETITDSLGLYDLLCLRLHK